MNHPMNLHGMPMRVFAKDGWPINPPQMCDTIDVAPDNRYDVIVEASEVGTWVFHCHILSHAGGAQACLASSSQWSSNRLRRPPTGKRGVQPQHQLS